MIDHEVEDNDILNEKPSVFWIGKHGKKKKIIIEMLTISKYYDFFVPSFLLLIQEMRKLNDDLVFPTGKEWEKKKDYNKIAGLFKSIFSHKIIRKKFILLLKSVGYLKGISKRWFGKQVKPLELIDIFLYVYKHNIDGFKKKLQLVLERILEDHPEQNQQLQTFTGSSSKKGGLKEKLKPRFPKLPKSKSPC